MSTPIEPVAAAHHFLSGCVQAGMRHVVLSPGSRSTPLTVAATLVDGLEHSIHLDERTAAFVALGRAKLSGHPVGLVCTSGTAAANHLPAVAEAGQSGVPLVVLTADRPPELQDWGAGQTFDQTRLFGSQVVDQIEMPVGGDAGLDHAVRAGWRATETAATRCGPVHVNWPFRLPLEPTAAPLPPVPRLDAPVSAATGLTAAGAAAVRSLTATPHGLIVAGPNTCHPSLPGERDAIFELARRTGWPIVADTARAASDRVLADWPNFTEAHLARALSGSVATDTPIVASSSMPIRDLDAFAHLTDARPIVANRGINGIDGVVATASGVAGSHPSGRSVVLIGDVAVLHDIGSVLDAARHRVNLTLVVPNNDGGGIFSFLPIHDALDPATYRELFHTPHGTTFEFLAGHRDVRHFVATTAETLSTLVSDAIDTPGVDLIEVPVDTPDAVAIHRSSAAAVVEALR